MLRLSNEFRSGLDSASETFHQGITPDVVNYLLGRGLTRETIIEHKLGTVTNGHTGYADYQGMISIPYLTPRGGVCALKVRQSHDCTDACGHSKYLQAAGDGRLYNTGALDRADRLGYVAICEGEFDAIVASSLCGIPAVGIPGVTQWSHHPEWPSIFRGYNRVLVFRDMDAEGLGLAKRIAKDLDTVEIVSVPAKDVSLAYMQVGSGGLRKLAGL